MRISFNEQCYNILKKVPRGKVVTYKYIARKLKSRAYRAVGNAMHKNSNLKNVPCYRVVKSNGDVGEYALGRKKKIELLRRDGIEVINGKVDLERFQWQF